MAELAGRDADIVLNGIDGAAGLVATMTALEAGTPVALANKESLIIGGDLVVAAAEAAGGRATHLLPVDSEHSALAQCLRSGRRDEVARLVITASGGPFRGRTRDQLADVTAAEALDHPTWDMGPLITVNSSTLANKGLELVEAHLLFDVGLRPHRGGGASPVDRALDGRVRRWLHDRATVTSRHAPAHPVGTGVA